MTAAASAPSPSICPYLFYDDVEQAARFMQDAFAFTLIFSSPDPKGRLAHAQLGHGNGVIMLGHTDGGMRMVRSASALPALHAAIYVYVDDVDAHCAKARAAGANVIVEPADQPWGDRMYGCTDREGQFWMFAKRLLGSH